MRVSQRTVLNFSLLQTHWLLPHTIISFVDKRQEIQYTACSGCTKQVSSVHLRQSVCCSLSQRCLHQRQPALPASVQHLFIRKWHKSGACNEYTKLLHLIQWCDNNDHLSAGKCQAEKKPKAFVCDLATYARIKTQAAASRGELFLTKWSRDFSRLKLS